MANASGLFGLTLEKFFLDTVAKSIESETDVKAGLITNSATPNFDTWDFRDDWSTSYEPGNSGTYTAGGSVVTSTEITVASPAATQMKYATSSPQWTSATLTAHGLVGYVLIGSAATDMLLWDSDFGGDVASVSGTYTVTCPTNGWFYLDYA